MCKENKACGCMKAGAKLKVNFASVAKKIKYNGKDTVVVPVIMAISAIVMNGAFIPVEEWFPDSWNGVPVTIDHPESNGDVFTANTPENLINWSVGRIFNATIDGDKLKGDAYIDVEDCKRISPETWKMIEGGEPLNVSTGYFASVDDESGTIGGVEYHIVHRNIRPDHLAFLPKDDGACSWENGCGVRFNKKGSATMSLKDKLGLGKKVKNAEEPEKKTDDLAAMISSLIENDDSPFVKDDEEALKGMSADTLKSLSEQYKPKEEANEEPPAKTDAGDEVPAENGKKAANKTSLSSEDHAALEFAHKVHSNYKADLIGKIVANSNMTKASIEKMDIASLEVIANGLVIQEEVQNYGGRATATAGKNEDLESSKAMMAPSLADAINNRNKKGA